MGWRGFKGKAVMTRVKVEGTVAKSVFDEFRRIHELEIRRAEAEDKAEPSVSHVLEMLLRKGIRAYKEDKK